MFFLLGQIPEATVVKSCPFQITPPSEKHSLFPQREVILFSVSSLNTVLLVTQC